MGKQTQGITSKPSESSCEDARVAALRCAFSVEVPLLSFFSLSLPLSLFLSLFLSVLNMCAFSSITLVMMIHHHHHHECVGRVCRIDTRYLTRRLNTRGGCFRERNSKSTNPTARRFRASI